MTAPADHHERDELDPRRGQGRTVEQAHAVTGGQDHAADAAVSRADPGLAAIRAGARAEADYLADLEAGRLPELQQSPVQERTPEQQHTDQMMARYREGRPARDAEERGLFREWAELDADVIADHQEQQQAELEAGG
jgi:hypothetical protein